MLKSGRIDPKSGAAPVGSAVQSDTDAVFEVVGRNAWQGGEVAVAVLLEPGQPLPKAFIKLSVQFLVGMKPDRHAVPGPERRHVIRERKYRLVYAGAVSFEDDWRIGRRFGR